MSNSDSDARLLGLLGRTEETRNYPVLARQIEKFGPRLESSEDLDVRMAYHELLERAEPCFEIERIHGKGSLLNLEHPKIQRYYLVDHIIHPSRIDAAVRYRETMQIPFDPTVLSTPPTGARKGMYDRVDEAVDATWVHSDFKEA